MKTVEMKITRCGVSGWYEAGTRNFRRVSRWIKIKQNYNPCPRNSLWDYVQDENGYKPYQEQFNPKNGLYLDYFSFGGRNYAIEQFLTLGNPFYTCVSYAYEDEDGKIHYLSGIDGENIYNPICIEVDDSCEYVRVYIEN